MLTIAAISLIISMMAMVVRAWLGKTDFDRILASNLFGTKTVALIVVISLIFENSMLIDIALVYGMINFITSIGFLRFFSVKDGGK
jgi:multicomponent Na+:H+ antiporter subunit F